jgi:sugar O-acyltransferase (sialic acid O-acetyltransferase NeuD family)
MLIVGAKGFAKELLEVLIHIDPAYEITFFDNVSTDLPELLYKKYKIIRNVNNLSEHFRNDRNFALGIGGTTIRKQLCDLMIENGGILKKVVSPHARIGHFDTIVSDGCTVMVGAAITNNIKLGRGCLVNLNSTIAHDCKIGEFCDIAPGVNIAGNVTIGNFCALGIGSVILPGVKLGNNVIVGAGAVVKEDVPDNITVVGIPAKPLLKK